MANRVGGVDAEGTLSISHTKLGQKGFYRTEMFPISSHPK